MADRFMGAFSQVERNMASRYRSPSDPTDAQFSELVLTVSTRDIGVNEALKLLQIYFEEYRRQGRTRAVRCCVFEMERILAASDQKALQLVYPHLDFSQEVIPSLREFVKKKRQIYSEMVRYLYNRWLVFVTLLILVLLALAVLLFHAPFWLWFFILGFSWFVLVWYGKYKEVPYQVQRMQERMYGHLDRPHAVLLKRWDLQTPSYFKSYVIRYWQFQDRRKARKQSRKAQKANKRREKARQKKSRAKAPKKQKKR